MSLFNNEFKSTNIYGAFKVFDYPGIFGVGAVTSSFDMSGTGIFRGNVSFANQLPTCTITPTTGNQLITKSYADATYAVGSILASNNVFTGTNAFNTSLPTSTVTPINGTDLVSKTYTDTALNLKANLASPTFTGTVGGINSTMIGLGNVNNTSDANKPVSTAQQTALNLKADLASPTLTGTPLAPTASLGTNTTQVATTAFVLANSGSGILSTNNNWTGTNYFSNTMTAGIIASAGGFVPLDIQSQAGYVPLNIGFNNTFTMNIGANGCTTEMRGTYNFHAGLSTYTTLPQSTATPTYDNEFITKLYADTALNLKANLASPTFTGTVGGINKTMVGLANVDNTSDANKPVSTATTTALNLKANLASPTFTGGVSANSVSVATSIATGSLSCSGEIVTTTLRSGTIAAASTMTCNKLTITDATSTPASGTNGTLILKHNTAGGSSSIVFPSTINIPSDYAYIQFDDNRGAGGESNRLTIGTQNDGDDDIFISPSGRLYVTSTSYFSNWVRVSGNEGFYFETYGGGWNMVDSTYVRSYNDKRVYTATVFQQGQLGGGFMVTTNLSQSNYVSDMRFTSGYIQMNKFADNFVTGQGAIGINFFNSDLRLKENIAKPLINDACDLIKQIHFVSFQWKDREYRTDDGICELGIIAQELELIYPDLIQTLNDDDTFQDGIGTKSVNTNCFSTFMMKGIQELILTNEKQQAQIDLLTSQVAMLMAK